MSISAADRAILDSPRHAVLMELDDICAQMEFADAADLERLDAAHVAVIAKLRAIDEAPTAPICPVMARDLIRDVSMPLIEQVRQVAGEEAGPEDQMNFYGVSIRLGAKKCEAEAVEKALTIRTMRAAGAI